MSMTNLLHRGSGRGHILPLTGFLGILLLALAQGLSSAQQLADLQIWLALAYTFCALLILLPARPAQPRFVAESAPKTVDNSSECRWLHIMPDLLWRIDFASRSVTPLNNQHLQGHPQAPEHNGRLNTLFPARVSRLFLESLITTQNQQKAARFEYQLGAEDGSIRSFEACLQPLNTSECMVIIRDITMIKDTEEALLNQQVFLQQIIDSSPSLIFVRDQLGRFLLVNRETQAVFGHELLMQSHMGLTDEDAPLTLGDAEVLATGEPVHLQDEWIDAHGQRQWFDLSKIPLNRGEETYILTTAINITALRHEEVTQIASDGLIRVISDTLPTPFLYLEEGIIQFANQAACQQLGQTPQTLFGQPLEHIAQNAAAVLAQETQQLQSPEATWPCSVHAIPSQPKTQLIVLRSK